MAMVIGHCRCSSVADIGLDVARRTVMEGEGSLQVTVRVLGDRQLDSPVTVGLSTVSLNATGVWNRREYWLVLSGYVCLYSCSCLNTILM